MKTLHLLRHAKSAWDEPGLGDRERGLSPRGYRDAPRMGAALSAQLAPMAIHASPARRAQLTLQGVCEGWPALADVEHSTVEALYTFDAEDLVDWLLSGDDSADSLFLVGHNPALTDLVNWLAADAQLDNLPTAAYARLELAVDSWRDLQPGCARLQCLLRPRDLD
ncbi:SixA phosphatase family protein [Haliea sp. E17]|uniref:SixA phosphatase family protein n=1 Tax=Haliea sp. E17 TaxID=3401576 RepID=UPI003AAB2802